MLIGQVLDLEPFTLQYRTAEFNITYLNHHFKRYYHLASNMTPRHHQPRSGLQSYFKILWDVFVLFSYHERAGDIFVMPYWKVQSGLLSTLSHPDPTRWSQVGCGWIWMDIRPDHTFQQGVTNDTTWPSGQAQIWKSDSMFWMLSVNNVYYFLWVTITGLTVQACPMFSLWLGLPISTMKWLEILKKWQLKL